MGKIITHANSDGSSHADVVSNTSASHTRQHAIDATADHTGTATSGNVLEADANGLPADSGIASSSLSSLPVVDTTAVVKGSTDATKLVRIEADGLTAGTTRVITMPDNDVDLTDVHTQSHTIASHNDTTATGAELETLTDGSNADALHAHSGTTDADAIHDNVSGEISAISAKGTVVDADILLIEDSAATNSKKKTLFSTVWTYISGKVSALHFLKTEHLNTSAGAGDAGKPIKLDAAGHVDATMINSADVDHGATSGLLDDDHTQYSLISSQAGTPTSTPTRKGEVNIDTTNDRVYLSKDTTGASDWVLVNSRFIVWRVLEKATLLTVGTNIGGDLRLPLAAEIKNVWAYLDVAGTGSVTALDINEAGTSIMTTDKISIDATGDHSKDAGTQPVLTDTSIAQWAKLTCDIDTIASGGEAAGLTIVFEIDFTG